MDMMTGRPASFTGAAREVVVPSPSSPLELPPHTHTLPSPVRAIEKNAPAATAVAPASPAACTEGGEGVVRPSPSWPE